MNKAALKSLQNGSYKLPFGTESLEIDVGALTRDCEREEVKLTLQCPPLAIVQWYNTRRKRFYAVVLKCCVWSKKHYSPKGCVCACVRVSLPSGSQENPS